MHTILEEAVMKAMKSFRNSHVTTNGCLMKFVQQKLGEGTVCQEQNLVIEEDEIMVYCEIQMDFWVLLNL